MVTINTDNKIVAIDSVKPNEYNPKLDFKENEDNGKEFEKIKQSLSRHGQVDPVLVRELEDGTFEIVNGFHRYEAMKELGATEIEVKNLGKIDFDKAVAYALSTEATKVPIDDVELAALMKRLVTEEKGTGYWAELLPYEAELLQSKIDLLDFDVSQFDKEGEGDSGAFNYQFKFDNNDDLMKVEDYFDDHSQEEKNKMLLDLIGKTGSGEEVPEVEDNQE